MQLARYRVFLILNKAKYIEIWNIYGLSLILPWNIFKQINLELAEKSILSPQRCI